MEYYFRCTQLNCRSCVVSRPIFQGMFDAFVSNDPAVHELMRQHLESAVEAGIAFKGVCPSLFKRAHRIAEATIEIVTPDEVN